MTADVHQVPVMDTPRPVVLVVIDGWGVNSDPVGNAIAQARTPVMDALMHDWASTTVGASGAFVGLPDGQQGNSEVGHLTIGTGRVVFQDLPRISHAIDDGSFFENVELVGAIDRARSSNRVLHVMGLISPGGVHSHQDHALALVELARRRGLDRVAVHAFLDGRDEPPRSAVGFVQQLEAGLERVGVGGIATICGRYHAMDRDRRWDRTERAYRLLTGEAGEVATSAIAAIQDSYARGITDEFVEPTAIVPPGRSRIVIQPGDTIVFVNFRPDRARQLCHALVDATFDPFTRPPLNDLSLVTFTEYEAGLTPHVAFPKLALRQSLAEVAAEHHLTQFHVAETEKYAHVTYFINGGREVPFAGEERRLVPSPAVATYDLAPAMSADAVTDAVIDRLRSSAPDLVILNYANPDMVGHTGDLDATVQAVEVVDRCLGRLCSAVLDVGGALVVTADHGNAELKVDPRDGSRLTAHTCSPVPVVVVGAGTGALRNGGGLADVAPTVLGILGIPVPAVMTGTDLRQGTSPAG